MYKKKKRLKHTRVESNIIVKPNDRTILTHIISFSEFVFIVFCYDVYVVKNQ